ncbi:hypothetical protein ER308_15215 [Egibacter rhizosphaerae]|uniref:WxL domain-containing protein n=1 Tax=Egibacter rhizosphaerae TaxID=1670831 RepID=A0A411YHR1_9ACTN|nr:hypothetical protein [Egibacter rhizosphaerae]QBI20780.1 hypothetical protein ER308_15215 [Egibacter rhizosphaerae]
MLAVGGSLLVTAGLAGLMVAGPTAFAEDTGVTANAEVASTISIAADEAAFTLADVPGETASNTSGLTVQTNNEGGYNVAVEADVPALEGESAENTDDIPIGTLEVQDGEETYASMSDTESVTVHGQTERSAEGGDTVTASYQMEMPFVNADTYSGDLTFTATAN